MANGKQQMAIQATCPGQFRHFPLVSGAHLYGQRRIPLGNEGEIRHYSLVAANRWLPE